MHHPMEELDLASRQSWVRTSVLHSLALLWDYPEGGRYVKYSQIPAGLNGP